MHHTHIFRDLTSCSLYRTACILLMSPIILLQDIHSNLDSNFSANLTPYHKVMAIQTSIKSDGPGVQCARRESNGYNQPQFSVPAQKETPPENDSNILENEKFVSSLENYERERQDKIQNASMNAAFQDIWEGKIEGLGTTGKPHRKTAVLMVSWAKELSDIKNIDEEIDDLATLFRDRFSYKVREEKLKAGSEPSHQLNTILAKFIEDFDNESTLMIVYYAGMASVVVLGYFANFFKVMESEEIQENFILQGLYFVFNKQEVS